MAGKITTAFALFTVAAFLTNFGFVQCSPAIASSFEAMAVCIENCVLCKTMFGAWFDGPLCADSCIEYMGKRIPESSSYDSMAVCIENCAQCKRMFGAWFDGPLCAESCIEYMGKRIPECEDFSSIKSFVTKLKKDTLM